jgi:hypothetical protein
MAVVRRDRTARSFDRLERPTLREEEKNAVATHVIGSHPAVLMDARESENITIEGGSPVEIDDIQGGLKDLV